MDNRVDYLSDKLVHVRDRIKARQQACLGTARPHPESSRTDDAGVPAETPEPVSAVPATDRPEPAPSAVAAPVPVVEAARPAADQTPAFLRRYDQTLQLRRDLEQRLVHCVTQTGEELAEIERRQSRLAELSDRLQERMAALHQLTLPEAETLSVVALGDLYRAIDCERLEFFQLEARIEALTRLPEASASGDGLHKPLRFKQAFKLGLGFTLPLILGLGGAVLLGALLLFLSWR